MTQITTAEIKIIAIQVILMAVLGMFMILYNSEPVLTQNVPNSATIRNDSVSASDASWINNLISIPSGMGDLAFITLLVISPFLFFDAFIAIRFAKDIATNWI